MGCHLILGLTGAPEQRTGTQLPDAGRVEPAPADGGHTDPAGNAPPAPGVPANLSPECTRYCADVDRTCTAASGAQQYLPGDCARLCPELEEEPTALGCRDSALVDRGAAGCARAGPTGVQRAETPEGRDDACEDPCELYCRLMRQVCGETPLGLPGEPEAEGPSASDEENCRAVCEAVPATENFDLSPLPAGNNLNCRIHHINLSLSAAPGTNGRADHCLHAAGQRGIYRLTATPCQD
jgi:hypothetical protein